MARGWESKSVESQIDMAEERRAERQRKPITPEDAAAMRKREGLVLSRTRVQHELENARNARYRGVLTKALADLDAQLAALPPK